MQNITPLLISSLKANEVFVFGSNTQGNHLGGAALTAYKHFGAIWGQGVGLQGQSYAIPTLELPQNPLTKTPIRKLPIKVIEHYVNKFITFAKEHDELTFYVTKIGCGIASFTTDEIAPLFKDALDVDNIYLPQEFVDYFTK